LSAARRWFRRGRLARSRSRLFASLATRERVYHPSARRLAAPASLSKLENRPLARPAVSPVARRFAAPTERSL